MIQTFSDDSGPKAESKKSFSGKGDWETPGWLCEWIIQYRPVDLDPCTSVRNPLRARRGFVPPEDALEISWGIGNGAHVYMNPPYGRSVGKWIDKLLIEIAGVPGAEATVLVRLDNTRWFRDLMDEATAIVIPTKRIKFWDPHIRKEVGGTNFASALVNVGGNSRHWCHHFEHIAQVGAAFKRW